MQANQTAKGFARGFAVSVLPILPILPILLAQGGCSSDVNPVKAAYIGAGYGPRDVAAPDFVEASRRKGVDYMPVGTDAPKRADRPRTAESRKALEAELEGARNRNEARGRAAGSAGSQANSPADSPAKSPAKPSAE